MFVNIYVQNKSAYVETAEVTNKRIKSRREEAEREATRKSASVLNKAFKKLKRDNSGFVVDTAVSKKSKVFEQSDIAMNSTDRLDLM